MVGAGPNVVGAGPVAHDVVLPPNGGAGKGTAEIVTVEMNPFVVLTFACHPAPLAGLTVPVHLGIDLI